MSRIRFRIPFFLILGVLALISDQCRAYAVTPIALQVRACPGHIQISVINVNAEQYATVTVQTHNGQVLPVPMVNSSHDGSAFIDYYQAPVNLGFDSGGIVTASFADGSSISAQFATDECGLPYQRMSSARGSVFHDLNGNGLRDANEAVTFSWFKISDGGSWYICGFTGMDGTFGVPLKSGWYDVIPVAPKGWRATTPKQRVYVGGPGYPALNIHLGLIRDDAAPLESCDHYHPIR